MRRRFFCARKVFSLYSLVRLAHHLGGRMRVGAIVLAVLLGAGVGNFVSEAHADESGRTYQISAGVLRGGPWDATSLRGEGGYALGESARLLVSVERISDSHFSEPFWGFSLQPALVFYSDRRLSASFFAGPRIIATFGENFYGDRRTFYDVQAAGGVAFTWRAGWTWGFRGQTEAIKSTGFEYGGFPTELVVAFRVGPYLQF